MTKQLQVTLAAILVMSNISVPAQTSSTAATPAKAKKSVKKESATEQEIRELQEQMKAQQSQIDALKQQNAEKDAKLAAATQDAQTANSAASAATQQAQSVSSSVQENKDAVDKLSSTVNDLKTTNVGLAQTISDTKKDLTEKIDSPLALHYKGVTFTPVAFFAAESVYRTRAMNSDINTPFGAVPFMNSGNAYVSEFNATGRQSRLGGLFEGKNGIFKFSGYFEADFLNAGVTSNNNESNSYPLRQRQIWGQVATDSGFKFTGGQMWSLVTETKTGTEPRTENLPQTIDPQYHVGFSWARQYGVRVQQKFGTITTAALSLEGSQTTFAASNAPTNFFIGGAGNGGGLFNPTTNYTNNVSPDIIAKLAFDPKHAHLEIGGVASIFRDRYYPNATSTTPTSAGATNSSKVGGGVLGNIRVSPSKYVDIGLHVMAGDGVGRYGTVGLPDTTVHPDGTLEPLRAYQGLFSLEMHPTKKLDIWAYAGSEYVQRTTYMNTAGKLVGYAPITINNTGCNTEGLPGTTGNGFAGAPPYTAAGSCGAATRVVSEGSLGYTYRFYQGPKGRLQYELMYSYLQRGTWDGNGGLTGGAVAAPKGTNNMVFTSFRYYIP
ncbi:MAG: hypothetical protein KGK08_07930 [Acidobacteriota bacterium]|nr:hypothetical protein [Acidobacteriota bacterium]